MFWDKCGFTCSCKKWYKEITHTLYSVPLMVISCKTNLHYHNHVTNIDTVRYRTFLLPLDSLLAFYNHTITSENCSLFPNYNILISKMLAKWNQILGNLWELTFCIQQFSGNSFRLLSVSIVGSFEFWSSIQGKDVPLFI